MYHEDWIDEIHVNEWAVFNRANVYDKKPSKALKTLESLLLLKTITLLDLSTLFGDDSFSNVTALVNKSVQPLCRSLLSKVLNNVITLVKNLNNATVQKTHSLKVNIDTKDEIKIAVKVTGNTEIQINDKLGLNYEDFVEVKQLLKAFHLDNDSTLNDSLEKFLSLKNDQSDCHNEPKKTIRIAAICIYPAFVGIVAEALKDKRLLVSNAIAFPNDAKNYSYYKKDLKRKPLKEDVSGHYLVNGTTNEDKNVNGVPIASVAAAFPTGLYPLESKIKEIHYAVKNGATEIDIVISRYLVLGHRWYELFDEIQTLRKACGNATMKTILAVGECGSLENVYKASMVAMMAGTDFIKTSTGKEAVNATFASGLVMCRAIKTFYLKTGKKIGFKPAGGVRTAEDSLKWINLVVSELGADWLSLFRIGASSVLKNIEQRLKELSRD